MTEHEPVFVDLDPYNVLFTQESEPRSFIIRPAGGRFVAVTLEGEHVDEVIATYPNADAAEDAYIQAAKAVTFNDAIRTLKAMEKGQ